MKYITSMFVISIMRKNKLNYFIMNEALKIMIEKIIEEIRQTTSKRKQIILFREIKNLEDSAKQAENQFKKEESDVKKEQTDYKKLYDKAEKERLSLINKDEDRIKMINNYSSVIGSQSEKIINLEKELALKNKKEKQSETYFSKLKSLYA